MGSGKIDPKTNKNNSHGTHVVGSIAAEKNGSGTVGVAPDAQLMALKVFAGNSEGQQQNEDSSKPSLTGNSVADAINYAVSQGAKVINMSLSLGGSDSDVITALENAKKQNVVVVSAAGNYKQNKEETPQYPAFYSKEGLGIAVGAVDKSLTIGKFSNPAGNFAGYPFVTAPGVGVYSIGANGYNGQSPFVIEGSDPKSSSSKGLFFLSQGTSMASPHVAGVATLMLQANGNLTPDQVAQILTQTATTTGLKV